MGHGSGANRYCKSRQRLSYCTSTVRLLFTSLRHVNKLKMYIYLIKWSTMDTINVLLPKRNDGEKRKENHSSR